jgi:EmrB/QacA subfamily drug resistance transporter
MTQPSGSNVNKNIILVISTLSAFIMPFLMSAVNVALPTMGRDFNMEAVVMSWVSTAYLLSIAVFQVPFGRLSDIFGRRRLFLMGICISTASSFMGFAANNVSVLLASRVLQGIGAGMTYNNSVAILTSVFPPQERGKALGISQAGTYLGLSLGPPIGGFLTEALGWRSIFLVSGILGAGLVALIFFGMRAEWREARGERFDASGSAFYAVATALFMYGFSSLPSLTGIILFPLGLAGLVLFVWWESRTESPVFDLSLFRRNRVFILSNLAALVTYISTFAVTFLSSLYLQYIKAYSAETAGLILITSSVFMTIFTLSSGYISQKFQPRLIATTGMGFNCVALFLFIFLGNNTAIWYIILALAMYGIGIGLFVSPNTNTIMSSVGSRVLGVASGTLGTMRTAGMMLSMGVMMILFSVYIGQAEITAIYFPQFLTSVRVGFAIFTTLCVGGLIAQLVARRNS